jgi:hypothetical protein
MAGLVARRLFLSWCHADGPAKEALVPLLMQNLRILNGVEVSWWEDSHLLVGDQWRRRIVGRIADCDYGVLLLSPGFFASEFIVGEELPWFVGPRACKGVLPVGLKWVPLDGSRALRGVEAHQVFIHGGRFFTETRGVGRERFAVDLAGAIRDRLLADDA